MQERHTSRSAAINRRHEPVQDHPVLKIAVIPDMERTAFIRPDAHIGRDKYIPADDYAAPAMFIGLRRA